MLRPSVPALAVILGATVRVQGQPIIVESRTGGLNFAAYSDSVSGGNITWGNSTIKSTAPGVTAGIGCRFAPFSGTAGTPSFTVVPPLAAGVTYIVEVTHTTAGNNCSPDIIVAIGQTGCSGLPPTTDAFQAAKGNGVAWYPVGYVTATVASPTISFAYASGTLAGTGGRFYADAVRFTPVDNPSLESWNVPGNSAWFTAGNWNPAFVPGAGNWERFGVSPSSGTTGIGINQNDITTSPIGLKHAGPIEVTSARNNLNLIVGNSSTTTAGTLQIWGSTVNSVPNTVLRNNGSGTTTLMLQDTQGSGNRTMPLNLVAAGGTPVVDATKDIVISSAITIATGGLLKIGAGTLTLGGANTYTGGTTVGAGTLVVAGSLSAGSDVTASSGGTLSGTGTIGGSVTINAGATLAPGVGSGIGTLTINGALNLSGNTVMKIDRNGAQTGTKVKSNFLYIGHGTKLTIVNIGAPPQAGDTFSLFSATTYSNSFSTFVLPTLAPGLQWDISSLGVDGSIKVSSSTSSTIVLTCSSNITVAATSPAGAVVTYTSSATGSCPPVNVNCNPPSGSTFPIGMNVVTCQASDACGGTTNCSFTVTVEPPPPEYFFVQAVLPPPGSVYISPAVWHALYNNGIVIKDVRHRFFTQNYPLPPLGVSQVETFSSEVDFSLSTDNGATYQPASGTANVSVRVTHSQDVSGTEFFDTEMLQLDLTGPGFMLRESPTLQSTGQTTVRPVAGGYMISSFFDVFTEVSLDGGSTWTPAQQAGHVEMHPDPKQVTPVPEPTPILPPPNAVYVSPALWHALFAQGIVIRDVRHKLFTTALQPPGPGITNIHNFNSQLDLQVSTDGGSTYQYVRVPAPVQVTVASHGSSTDTIYDTEMTSLNLTLPGGIMIRESPSLPSRGQTEVTTQADGTFRIGSFFDIFTEVSLDGGATWQPATNGPVRMELTTGETEVPKANPNLPPLDGNYVSPQQWHALYATGVIITNASHNRFTQTYPPPPPGGSQVENFGSQVGGLISLDGGASFQPFSAPANVAVQVQSRSDLDNGNTRYFDTEMLALSLSGGNLPGGVMVRESPTKASLGRTSVRTTSSGYMVDSFFDIFTEVSLDGGATWSPGITHPGTMGLNPPSAPIAITCPADITAQATSPAGAVVTFMVTASGGCGPLTITANPPSGSSFPIGTTMVTATASDLCGGFAQCTFLIIVKPPPPEYFFPQPLLPPPGSVYISPALYHVLFNNGIIIRDVRHRFFTVSYPLPPLGASQTETFSSEVDFSLSTDNGATWQPATGTANVTVHVTHSQNVNGVQVFDTEMLQLDLAGPGFMLRESPTLQSTGQTTARPVAGGYMISSFFDVFTEVSLDGGLTWTPAQQAGHVEMHPDPKQVTPVPEPTPILPPPNGVYISPQQWHALFAQGIVIRDVRHKLFTTALQPPGPGITNVHNFNSQLDLQVSTDGGSTFQYVRVAAPVQVTVASHGSATDTIYDTEMTSLNLTLPGGIMIRESPSLPSRGQTEVTTQADGTFRIGSFFDIFTEVSLDGGATWSGATNGPVRMQLTTGETEVPKASPNLPPLDGNYVSPQQWHALYANGIIITNASHNRFLQSQPPPPPGGSQTENFGSQVTGMISLDGGANFQPFSAPASVSVQLNSRADLDNGNTRYFDTEMLALNLSGGNLPGGIMVRESPTKASLGRTSVRTTASDYRIDSFFDIFTEVSLDGGATWSPGITHPGTMGLNPPSAPIVVTCPPNSTVQATSPAGAVVTYTATATGGCSGLTISGNPASGSTFPIGTNTVTVTASDLCGGSAQCTFLIIVKPIPPEYFFPTPVLPPPGSVYISPALYHVLFNNGIIIRDVRHRFFTVSYPLPPLGASQTETFNSEVDFSLSTDNGATYQPATGTANVTVHVTHSQDVNGVQVFDTEMLQLDLVSGAIHLRESPTLQSTGQTTVRPVAGGYLISSFFDVFTEVSLDGGATWTPATSAGHVEMHPDPKQVTPVPVPTPILPPPNGVYISPQLWHALFAQGIVIRDLRHKLFTTALQPPGPSATNVHNFNSQLDMQVSTDGGNSYQYVRVAAPVQVTVASHGSSTDTIYDTEMTSLNLTLPSGIMIRESPSLPSRGQTEIMAQGGGTFRISSFFDIFTEVSLDGGATWSGATNGPVRMELTTGESEVPKASPNLPPLDGNYVSPQQWHALYANGIIITNASHNRFLQSQPPPPPGGSQTENFGSQVSGLISLDGGAHFQPFSAPASVSVQVNSRSDEDNGNTRYFDTEMLALNLSGGNLPGGIMVRESPTKASLGRTSVRTAGPGDYRIDSFFDIFTEVSLDGGATWSPGVTHPGTMGMTSNNVTIVLTCSSNITVTAAPCSNSVVVFYSSSASGGCTNPNVICTPPSGSTFPLGTTMVTCTASDTCGNSTNCSFNVTVNPYICPPLVLNCSSNVTVTAASCTNSNATVFFSSSASGGCAPLNLVCNPPSGSSFPLGTTPVTCTATDACGHSTNCNFEVTVKPYVCAPIVLTCSSNVTITAAACSNSATVFFSSSASGGCAPLNLVCNPPSGSSFPLGTTPVQCTATDSCGNSTNCGFFVTVNPFVCAPIVLNCSSNVTVTAAACSNSATVFFSSSASGGCAPLNLVCNPPSGSSFTLGTTLVTCSATDACGHTTNCSFNVTVNPFVCPSIVLNCSSNVTITAAACSNSATVFFSSSASGGCPPLNLVCNPPSGSSFSLGTTPVTCSATDACGHTTNCSFNVTVNPFVCPPIVLNCSSNITVTNTGCGSSGAVVFYSSSASGGCSPVNIVCNPPSGTTFPVGTTPVTCTATDACGHSTNCSFSVTVAPAACPPIVLTCSTNVTVPASSAAGAVVFYSSSASGGCPPVNVVCNPPSGTTFPVGATTVNCTATDACGHSTNCSFQVTVVPDYFTGTNNLPPTNTVYISPALWHALFANGVVIRDIRHRFFTHNLPPPILGTSQVHTFNSQLDFEVSTDNGATFQPVTVTNAPVSVQVTHTTDNSGASFFDTEMLQLDIVTPAFMLRESPSKASLGKTVIQTQPATGGYMISSFFDIFTEVSLDGGVTWTPANGPAHVEMRNDPRQVPPVTPPSSLLPPPDGAYVSPQQWHALFAQGIVISNVSHKFFTQSLQPPPPGGSNTHNFSSVLDLQVSTDGGKTFQFVRNSNVPVQVKVSNVGSGNSGMYDTEMTQLSLNGLPGGIMVRESPTRPSRGATQIDSQPDGSYRVGSFFDIFTEISLDGGATWNPPTNGPVRMQLTQVAGEVPVPTPNVPITNTPYISPAQWHAAYANGIYISNVTHRGFTQSYPPPPPGGSQPETFGSTVDGLISMDGGKTFQPFSAPATSLVQVNSRADQDTSSTRYFDTEMLSLSLSGGNLPGGVMVRESPSKASLGRTTVRTTPDGYRINSFFDIFTEISTDGGATWLPSVSPPATMAPRLPARKRLFPRPELPPTNSQYLSPRQWHALYANGIVISNVTHKRFLANMPPPAPRTTNIHNFGSIVTFQLSMGPGQPFQPMMANADCQVSVGNSGFQGSEQVFQTEMLSLNLSGGSLPPGIMIRESPSKRSLGETHYSAGQGGGGAGGAIRASSFFDIFTEISLDGGATWSPASAPGYMELHVDPGVPPTTILNPHIVAGVPTFTLQSQIALRYLLQYKNELTDPTWTTISITSGNGQQLDLIDCCPPPGPSRPHRFYRVQIQEDDSQ